MIRLESEDLLKKLAGPKSVDYFLEGMKDESIIVRSYSIRVIKEFPTSKAIPVLLTAINDKDIYIRRDAVHILGIIGDKSVIPELAKRLKDKDEEVRVEAVKSLGEMGDPEVVKYLKPTLKDKSSKVRLETIKVLSNYPDEEMVKYMQKLLMKEPDVMVKEQIIEFLRKSGDLSSVAVLKRMLKEPEPSIRKLSISALGELGDKSVIPDLRDMFRKEVYTEVKSATILSLAKLGDKEMIPEFLNALLDPSKELNNAARQGLDMLIDISYSKHLVGYLYSDKKAIRDYCIYALERLKPKERVNDLFNSIKTLRGPVRTQVMKLIDSLVDETHLGDFYLVVDSPSKNEDIELQLWVLRNLGKFKSKKSIEYLAQTVRHKNTDVRIATVETLSKIGGSEAERIIIYVAENDSSMKVRDIARSSLEKKR